MIEGKLRNDEGERERESVANTFTGIVYTCTLDVNRRNYRFVTSGEIRVPHLHGHCIVEAGNQQHFALYILFITV